MSELRRAAGLRFKVRMEASTDHDSIEELLDKAFGVTRHRKISYCYRVGIEPIASLALVAETDERLVGSIRYWPIALESCPALLLGPLAVDPGLRGGGIGRRLVRDSLALAASRGADLVFLVGDLEYYRQFGFERTPPDIVMPGEDPDRLQWLRLGSAPLRCRGTLIRDGGGAIEPDQQRRAELGQVLVAQHRLGHLAQPGSQGGGETWPLQDAGQRRDECADPENDAARALKPSQCLALHSEP